MTGRKTSELMVSTRAVLIGLTMAVYGIYKEADITALALLIPSVTAPYMWYVGARTTLKVKNGESNDKTE